MHVPTTKPFTYQLLTDTIHTLTAAYPAIEVLKIGTSRLGKIIYALTLGTGEKNICVNAAHHANEWITSVVAMKFLEACAKPHGIPQDVTLHMIPMVNPDGVDLVTGAIEKGTAPYNHAKKIASNFAEPFPEGWKANIFGVDLNSNYPAGWEFARLHKYRRGYMKPAPRDFVGPDPLSEPETTALAAYTKANDFALTISLHTQGEEIFWEYQHYKPKGAKAIAERLAAVSGYKLEAVPNMSAHGGYRDWFIEAFHRPGMTVECGLGENPLPIEDFDGIYQKVGPLLAACLEV